MKKNKPEIETQIESLSEEYFLLVKSKDKEVKQRVKEVRKRWKKLMEKKILMDSLLFNLEKYRSLVFASAKPDAKIWLGIAFKEIERLIVGVPGE